MLHPLLEQQEELVCRVADLEDALRRILAALDGHPVAQHHPAVSHACQNAVAVLLDRLDVVVVASARKGNNGVVVEVVDGTCGQE